LWQFRYDASKNLNENVTSLGEQGLGVLARSGPVVGQLGAKFALGVDPSTGRSVQYNTAGDVVKEFVNLLPALTGPAKGFAGVDLAQETGNIVDRILGTTPKASEQKEVTSDQALIAKINNLLGLSAFQPESEASRKRAKDLEKSRLKEQRRAEREAWQEQQQESE
jgi:hypothetical protein